MKHVRKHLAAWSSGFALLTAAGAAQAETDQPVLELDQTVISGNQELPKVLYILPWREPQGLPDIEVQAELTEAEVFRRLYPPAYRRELGYLKTLEELKTAENPGQEE